MFILLATFSCVWLFGQNLPDLSAYRFRERPSVAIDAPPQTPQSAPVGRLVVKAEPDSALRQQLERFRQRSKAPVGADRQGWRIQIYSGNGPGANNARFDFLAKYPEVEVYSFYDRPYYKVRVGNFKSKNEAQAFCDKIKSDFPPAFILPDKIAE